MIKDKELTAECIKRYFNILDCIFKSDNNLVYYYRSDGDYILIHKKFQDTVSIFDNSLEFNTIVRDYKVDNDSEFILLLIRLNII